jgi:hypothetical protein
MTKVITEEQTAALLATREEYALEELRELGLRISLYEEREFVDPDPLRGLDGGWKRGVCHAVADSVTGKRKTFSGVSAVDTLDQARSWLKYQERLKPEFRFEIVSESVAVPVRQQIAGDAAMTQQRRENTERRVIALEGSPHLVDAMRNPINGDITRASGLG